MCYLGGAWPEKYHGQLFMGNIHGRRINMDILKPKGSGYVASHGPDFLLANDEWARFINLKYGPDGNVYLIDWYDKQACHLQRAGNLGPHQRPHLQDQLPRHEAGEGIWICRSARTRNWSKYQFARERMVRAARAANSAGTCDQ